MFPQNFLDETVLTEEDWETLYKRASEIHQSPELFSEDCRGKILGTLFYEPSTRTRLSFETAMLRLGGDVIGFADPGSASVVKGESLKDTVKIVSSYCDILALRTPLEGGATAASQFSSVPVINAGDGSHLHPTQTLTDLFCIRHLRGTLDGLTVGFCGDLFNGRTVHSLIDALLRRKKTVFYLVSEPELRLPAAWQAKLKDSGVRFHACDSLDECIDKLDILYMTRIQRERGSAPSENAALRLGTETMARAKKDLLVLHPLPKLNEIAPEVDDDARAVYFAQARLGVSIRMALILQLLQKPYVPQNARVSSLPRICTNPKCVTEKEPRLEPLLRMQGGQKICGYCDREIL